SRVPLPELASAWRTDARTAPPRRLAHQLLPQGRRRPERAGRFPSRRRAPDVVMVGIRFDETGIPSILSVESGHQSRRVALPPRGNVTMPEENTPAIVQRYLDALGGEAPAEPIIRSLLDRAVCRLHQLCASLLHRKFPRLTRPPLNLQTDELLGAVVERLLKALQAVRPTTVRQFFALAGQHLRWELKDIARRLDT